MTSSHIPAFGFRKLQAPGSPARRHLLAAGFTLLEAMIVVTIILILAGMAAVRYEKSVLRAREATLKQDLFIMRNAIQQYTLDKEAGPSSLDDLVPKYISGIPVDPITHSKNWHTDSDPVLLDPQQTSPGITDVHSGSDQNSPVENTPYNTW
ncbi:MAG TPA: type II secretion system protein [Candidatus Acidoferrales bacterium]|nr:type II secretion system protein [Candidatus Acidoferrales bacterium]